MGYEMKLYIGLRFKNSKGIDNPNYDYFQKIAMFDYCNEGGLESFIDKYEPAKVYGFFTQENEEEIKDKYGEEFKGVPIEDIIKYMEKYPIDYRRYKPLLALLKAFKEEKEQFNNDMTELLVIRYGY